MATWKQFESEAAELAALIRARFEAVETHVLATLRKDGSPRVSGSEVAFQGPDLSFGPMLNAVKARDLQPEVVRRPGAGPARPALQGATGSSRFSGTPSSRKEVRTMSHVLRLARVPAFTRI